MLEIGVSKFSRNSGTPGTTDEQYALARNGFFLETHAGVLLISGADALPLLGRISTNDVLPLQEEDTQCVTVLTTEKARIVDIVTLIHTGNKLFGLTSPGNAQHVKKWIEKYIIMEDVEIADVTSEYRACTAYGTTCIGMLKFSPDLPPHRVQAGEHAAILFRNLLWPAPVVTVVAASASMVSVGEQSPRVDAGIVDILRLEDGVPLLGKELTGEINPLEAGLDKFISFTKGCYVGQEVIARLSTYRKLQKLLRGLQFEIEDEGLLSPGDLFVDERRVGFTTSHAWSPKLHSYIALGYVSTTVSGSILEFRNGQLSKRVSARLVHTPFEISTK